MRLEELCTSRSGGFARAHCRVHWESPERPVTSIEFAIPEGHAISPVAAPEAFLLAALAPAIAAGEERILIDAPLSQRLIAGIDSAIAILRAWSPADFNGKPAPRIEHMGLVSLAPASGAQAGAFYSGGVDSTHLMLAAAQESASPDWARIRHAICVYGFDIGGRKDKPDPEAFSLFVEQSKDFAHAVDASLLPVHTNLRHLDDRPGFWGRLFVGFALAAVAQTLREQCSLVNVATPGEPLSPQIQAPFGTHPSLAPYCNTEATRILMPYLEVSRFQRLALIARHTPALKALRVCFGSSANAMNCGRCEKCVRTQLGLLLSGVEPAQWFSGVVLDAALIDQTDIGSEAAANMASEMLASSAMSGFPLLKRATERQLARWQRYKAWRDGRTLGGRLRRLSAARLSSR